MATKLSRAAPRRPAEVVVRITMLFIGFFAVTWGGWSLPIFKAQASPVFVAGKILQGDSYKMPRLLLTARETEALVASYTFCNPVALHSLTAIRLDIFKNTIGGGDQNSFDSSYDALYAAARQTLTCSPADSFVWLTLFWIDAARHGLTADNANYLRMSYAVAPNEAWIALWRSHLAFALFERLPADLADDSLGDFVNLLKTRRVFSEMAKIFEDTSAEGQHRIIERVQTVDALDRQAFVGALRDKGLDINVPEGDASEPRPWR